MNETLKKVKNTIRLIPEIKTNITQDKKISNVCQYQVASSIKKI